MPRIHIVKKARKDPGQCSKCKEWIKAGSPYRWIKRFRASKAVRCMKRECRFRNSDLTSSDKLSDFYLAIENIEDAVEEAREFEPTEFTSYHEKLSEVKGVVEESAELIREVSYAYEESADNQDEYFPGSPLVDEIRYNAANAETHAYNLDSAASDLDTAAAEVGAASGDTESELYNTALDTLETVYTGMELD